MNVLSKMSPKLLASVLALALTGWAASHAQAGQPNDEETVYEGMKLSSNSKAALERLLNCTDVAGAPEALAEVREKGWKNGRSVSIAQPFHVFGLPVRELSLRRDDATGEYQTYFAQGTSAKALIKAANLKQGKYKEYERQTKVGLLRLESDNAIACYINEAD